MLAVPPDIPVTVPAPAPDGVTVATLVLLLIHTPPAVASENMVFAPAQKVVAPLVIAPATGSGFTVNDTLAVATPQLFDTV